MVARPCIAVVSPFLDKRHGTERCIAEQVERLAQEHGYEIHLYCQKVEDIAGLKKFSGKGNATRQIAEHLEQAENAEVGAGRIVWHKVSEIRGPHLLKYAWWFLANQWHRWHDVRSNGLRFDLVYSPGINCWDANVVIIHIVFHEFYGLVREELRFVKTPLRAWPRALHRKLYYRLIMALERRIYPNPHVTLATVSGLAARQVHHYFGRRDARVIPNAVDSDTFNPTARERRRAEARRDLGYADKDFVLLLIGNDWKNKGLDYLLEAVAACRSLPLRVLVVGRDDRLPYQVAVERLGLSGRVRFVEPSADVARFYSAADAYVGPSLHESFGLPPAEAMACGLPVIASITSGCSEMITDGVDGFLLRDLRNRDELPALIRKLFAHPELRWQLGANAARTARLYSWERNAREIHALLEGVLVARCPAKDPAPAATSNAT